MKKHDPTRTSTKVNKAESEFRRRWGEARSEVVEYVDGLPKMVVNRDYVFDVDYDLMLQVGVDIREILMRHLVDDEWLFQGYVGPAYYQGTQQAAANMAPQLALFAEVPAATLAATMMPAYQARYQLIRARVFEEMKGFAGAQADQLGNMLGRAILDGTNPLEVGRQIAERFGVETYRGERIARTEITTALRRGRLDEGEAAEEATGLKLMFMHVSAFAPTSRLSHMERHSRLFTAEECREWWAKDANSINCLCSTIEVFVDDNGEPLAKGIIKRAEAIKEKYQHRIDEAKDE